MSVTSEHITQQFKRRELSSTALVLRRTRRILSRNDLLTVLTVCTVLSWVSFAHAMRTVVPQADLSDALISIALAMPLRVFVTTLVLHVIWHRIRGRYS